MSSSQTHGARWPWFLIANLALLVFFIVAFGREYIGNMQVEQEISRLEQQASELTDDKVKTLDLVKQLSSSYYLEQEARTKEGLAKPGETRIVLTEPVTTVSIQDSGVDPSTISNPMRWFNYFFDRAAYDELVAL
jgi:cell division protein FtsB